MKTSDLQNYIRSGAHCHLVGIGGVSMSPLAEVLRSMDLCVSGSDMTDSAAIDHLRGLGIDVFVGHCSENIKDADFLVRTAAAHEDNVEIAAAREAGIPVFERAQAWGYIMRSYRNAVCVAGTHGKTTTTSMATHILMAAAMDPTVMIGGTLPLLKAGYRIGKGETIVMESCEYYNSFHSFSPTVAVVLNVEADHLDFFHDLDEIKKSFRGFAALVPDNGHIVCNGDDPDAMDALRPLDRELLTFGFDENNRVRGVNIAIEKQGSLFDIRYDGVHFAHIRLQVPGTHNILNALAAAAAAIGLGVPAAAVEEGLGTFLGAGRRFEYKGSYRGAVIYDDYAHHPSELHALLDMVQSLHYRRTILAFQPHTFTRTKALFSDFLAELSRVDQLFLAEIYAAREKNTIGISSKDLADQIPGAVYCPSFAEIENQIRAIAAPGDIILTVGAGDIYQIGENLVNSSDCRSGL